MNRLKVFCVACASVLYLNATAQKQNLPIDQVPVPVKTYVSQNFPNTQIVKFEKETKNTKVEYDVDLSDKTELEFNKNLKIKKIESKEGVPSHLIPASIREYVSAHAPGSRILTYKTGKHGQSVKLDNKNILQFDAAGKYLQDKVKTPKNSSK